MRRYCCRSGWGPRWQSIPDPCPRTWHACSQVRELPALFRRLPACPLPASNPTLPTPPHPAPLPALADFQEEEYVHALGDRMFNAEPERAGQRILKDFRTLALGRICLELPQHYEHVQEV